MPDTYRQRALELRARAANKYGPARKYFRGLAQCYEDLARQRGEWPERPPRPERPKQPKRPELPDLAERREFVVLLRSEGHTQRAIARRLGVSQQLINKILHTGRD
jgi:DNA-binding NarL/FixJ family response regulator